VNFTKMQGAGNDFVVIRPENKKYNWAKLAIAICDRHRGVGADGLLLLLSSKVADFQMRLFNQDGSESAACGNGMRCLVKYYLDANPDKQNTNEVTIETPAGVRRANVRRRGNNITEIQAAMGTPCIGHNGTAVNISTDGESHIDIATEMNRTIKTGDRELLLSLVSIGNPHAVHFYADSIQDFPLATLGPLVEQHRLFPDETNFEVARIVSRNKVEARVWERGVGETLACGTGACAITVAGRLLGCLDSKVQISLPGGTLTVEWPGKGDVYLSGPTETVFKGDWK
jgi:diaminopimelate epimerase